jgi:hypothetical protein
MSWVILYRSLKTEKVLPVVSEDAYSIREFTTKEDTLWYLDDWGMPDETPTQIVKIDQL